MHEEELLAWALLGSGGLGLILLYWAVVALAWVWNNLDRESRYDWARRWRQ